MKIKIEFKLNPNSENCFQAWTTVKGESALGISSESYAKAEANLLKDLKRLKDLGDTTPPPSKEIEI